MTAQIAQRNRRRELADMRSLFAGLICILIAVGIQMVHSASLSSGSGSLDIMFLRKHLGYLALAGTVAWLASRIDPLWLQRQSSAMLGVYVALLAAVLLPGVGARINGAQRWFRLGGFSMQPSELGRLIMPVVAAALLCRLRQGDGFRVRALPGILLPLVLVLPLIVSEPDLGATLFIACGYTLALFLGGWPVRYFLAGGLFVIPGALGLLILKPYQMQRITGFLAAWQDLSQAPWQIKQSLLSLGSGGLQGVGVGNGWQKLSYLPEANTDFVFAVIGEELGLAGTLTICFIWWAVYLTGRASLRHLQKQSFEWIVGQTLLLQLVLQAMVNVAVVTAMIPPKGVPHPFISYGGTNLLMSVVSVGLILGMSRSGQPPDASPVPTPEPCQVAEPASSGLAVP